MPAPLGHLDTAERGLFDAVDRAATQVGLAVLVVQIDAVAPRVIHASASLEHTTGRPLRELVDAPPWELVAPEDRERVRAIVRSRGPGAPPITVTAAMVRPDGSRRDVEMGAARVTTPSGELAICLVHDVTDARASVAALRDSEAQLRALVEDAPDGIVILRAGRIIHLNPVAARLLGTVEPSAVHGQLITDYLPPEDAARAIERMTRVACGERLGASEYRVRGDRERTIEIHSIPCHWQGAPALLAFARDTTERRHFQRELDRAARLAAVGTMAAAVAHEINNPLTYVQLSLQRLDRELAEAEVPASVREHVRNAMHGVERVATIVRDLRGFSRDDDAAPREVEVEQVIAAAVKIVEHELKHRARLVRRLAAGLPRLRAVPTRLEQVIVNLLINAAQALPAGDPTRDEISIDAHAAGDRVVIVVRDSGIGIAPADRDRAFEPFFTTKPAGEGTGLGLAVSKKIVEELGGTIAIAAAARGGTEVTVTLPATRGGAPVDPPAGALAASARLRVLVVDDEPLIRNVLRLTLARHHDVDEAGGGEAALARLAERRYDVILCDVMMPGMNGREVCERIRAVYPGLERRVVFITGGAFAPKLAEFLAEVDNPKLFKPFTEADVLGAVAQAARR